MDWFEDGTWEFNEADYERWTARRSPVAFVDSNEVRQRFWACPVRLVRSGTWRDLWNRCRVATSVLPLLALHTYPRRPVDDLERFCAEQLQAPRPPGTEPDLDWTPWITLSVRRIAKLCGVDVNSVKKATDALEAHNLLQKHTGPRRKYGGGRRNFYRLHRSLYPAQEQNQRDPFSPPSDPEDFVQVPGGLFYGGAWSYLPTEAMRHVLIVVWCMDSICDEAGFLSVSFPALQGDLEDDERGVKAAKLLSDYRAKHPVSRGDLQRVAGLSASSFKEALDGLLVAIFDSYEERLNPRGFDPPVRRWRLSLVQKGASRISGIEWFAVNRRALGWRFFPDHVNNRAAVERDRERQWPKLAARKKVSSAAAAKAGRASAKKAKASRRTKKALAEGASMHLRAS